MDGDINTLRPGDASTADPGVLPAADTARRGRPKTLRWFIIVGLVLGLVLAAFYGFNRYREQAIANFFAHNTPPPAQIAAVRATTETAPSYATGIGSLAAVHQVTITPEVGGRVTQILFQSGAAIAAGAPLVQLNDAPDRGDLANYEAQARLAEITLQRSQILAKRQFAPQETVDQNQAQLDQMRAQIAKTEAVIAQKLVRAPFAGRLGVRQVDLGQYLSPGAAVVTLTELQQLYVNFTLPTSDRATIRVGQQVELTADAFPGRRFTATVTTIEPQIRPDTRTMAVQGTLANPDESLLPGMFVNAAVVLPPEAPRVVLPETAIDYTLYGDSVFAIRQDGTDRQGKPLLKAHRVPVRIGARWDNKVAILSGLDPGALVVAAGQIKVQDGEAVVVTGNQPPQPPANPTPQ